MEIKPCTFAEVERSGLLDLYTEECSIAGLPRPAADPDKYKEMTDAGRLAILGCFQGDTIIGFVSFLVISTPHYRGRTIAATESIFVHPDHRAGGAGIKLLRAAESAAAEGGSIGLIVSTPAGSNLSKVMASLNNYRLTNEVYIRGFE